MSSTAPPSDWGWVLVAIAVIGAVVLGGLYSFYKELQKSDFIANLLGLRTKENPTSQAPSPGAFRFAEEFLARRTEFWLLYAQVFVAIFFIAAIAALLLVRVIDVEAGLPALSTVVGIVLGKTLLSAKGSPLTAQEQVSGLTPSNIKAPTLTANAKPPVLGTVLTADLGEWSGQLPIGYAYTWRRRADNKDEPISGQGESTYTVIEDDLGKSISVMISASNASGGATATSEWVPIPF